MPHDRDNKTFYEAVYNTAALQQVLTRHQFLDPELDRPRFGLVLKLSKRRWLINLPNRKETGVHVHFECTKDRILLLHIETWPYVGSLSKKPEVQAERQPEIELREQLHQAIRPELKGLGTIKVEDPANPADNPSANSAGRFPSDLPDDCTPEQYAGFVARIIDAVVPTVDRCIAKVMETRAQRPE
jgi:hypothetical protein